MASKPSKRRFGWDDDADSVSSSATIQSSYSFDCCTRSNAEQELSDREDEEASDSDDPENVTPRVSLRRIGFAERGGYDRVLSDTEKMMHRLMDISATVCFVLSALFITLGAVWAVWDNVADLLNVRVLNDFGGSKETLCGLIWLNAGGWITIFTATKRDRLTQKEFARRLEEEENG
eukprot:TRINITY_DN5155_c0_g1_i5.p2 TRINITY_DN5155_c0_g1~~TRINITY_DN5155_c0_g1_i5.p2  ORF type:complete len:177 (-),score=29.22 TRINITY_DN5155_c0_g1_i5:399-929(-)